MQTKEQWKNWKVVGSVATVAALGVGGLAMADPGQQPASPEPIGLEDQRQLEPRTVAGQTFTVDIDDLASPAGDDLDSPFTDDDTPDIDDDTDSPEANDDTDSPDIDDHSDSPDTESDTDSPDTDDDSPDQDDSPDADNSSDD